MAYDVVEHEDSSDDEQIPNNGSREIAIDRQLASPERGALAGAGPKIAHDNTSMSSMSSGHGIGITTLVSTIAAARRRGKNTKGSYDAVEEEDEGEDSDIFPDDAIPPVQRSQYHHRQPPFAPSAVAEISNSNPQSQPLHLPNPRRPCSPATTVGSLHSPPSLASFSSNPIPIFRTASGRSIALRHPTPDLQTLQGAYTGNIEHLEKTAERLSMTSSIDDAIKQLHDEQKRSDSRRSSLLSSRSVSGITRQASNTSSIVQVNSAARFGGFSGSYIMSPTGSMIAGSGRGRSASKSSKVESRPEPELEGRPLDSFVGRSSMSMTSPTFSPAASIAEVNEEANTLTKPISDMFKNFDLDEMPPPTPNGGHDGHDRPPTPASTTTFDQERMFADFDGTHTIPQPQARPQPNPQQRHVSENVSDRPGLQRRLSSGTMLSMARPQSYADPTTGQQMVYYPAPVPMMLNLPQKLSKNPSSMARNKRRSQVMSAIPAAARQSAVWLPDVLETEDDHGLSEDDPSHNMEYLPQHQRASMGGRRLTEDFARMPAHLRAGAYFELPETNQTVELKHQSAMATLESILDASAHAPVGAFTDHAFAGRLGAEVYGRAPLPRNRTSSTTMLLEPKKRTSTFNNLLRGRRASNPDLLDGDEGHRRATMSGVIEGAARTPLEDDDEDAERDKDLLAQSPMETGFGEGSDEGQREEDMYQGAPTTLLAELQLRKQQQKQRTRPLMQSFPNGMHSTLLEMDAVAQVEKRTRKGKRINLAWEDPAVQQAGEEMDDDEDVPLALLYAKQEIRDPTRPMGLMERREMEDNEPLSRRRDRLLGRPPMPRASTMMHVPAPPPVEEIEDETLAHRIHRLKEEAAAAESALPKARPVSGDFASELMSQFGGDVLDQAKDNTSPAPEEEETLGQRRKRLIAEREARAKEFGHSAAVPSANPPQEVNKRRSMANILQAHPAAGASRVASYQKPVGGLLALHEKHSSHRSSTMLDFNTSGLGLNNNNNGNRVSSGGHKSGIYNDGQGGIIPGSHQQQQFRQSQQPLGMFPQPSINNNMNNMAMNGWGNPMWANPYANMQMGMGMGYPAMNQMNMGANQMNMSQMNMGMMNPMINMMNMPLPPLNQGQLDMVERWRQSVMQ